MPLNKFAFGKIKCKSFGEANPFGFTIIEISQILCETKCQT